jgi:site-specific recombinase XerD
MRTLVFFGVMVLGGECILSRSILSFENYLEFRNKSPRTIEEYGYDLRMFKRYLKNAFGIDSVTNISDLDDTMVEGFLLYLKNEKRNQRGEHLSPVTINRKYFALRSFFDFLIKRRLYEGENPMRLIEALTTVTVSTHTYLSHRLGYCWITLKLDILKETN